MPGSEVLWLALILFGAHVLATITGFGSAVLALPLMTLLLGLDLSRATLMPLGVAMSLWILLRQWRAIDYRQLRIITLTAGLGLPVGMALFSWMPRGVTTLVLGVVVVLSGIWGLSQVRRVKPVSLPAGLARGLLFAGGVVHGSFTIGGSLLTIYSADAMREKQAFRVTLSVVWLVLNAVLITQWTWAGSWPAGTWRYALWSAPFVAAGIAAGEWLQSRLRARPFHILVQAVILVCGVVLVYSVCGPSSRAAVAVAPAIISK